MELVNFRFT